MAHLYTVGPVDLINWTLAVGSSTLLLLVVLGFFTPQAAAIYLVALLGNLVLAGLMLVLFAASIFAGRK